MNRFIDPESEPTFIHIDYHHHFINKIIIIIIIVGKKVKLFLLLLLYYIVVVMMKYLYKHNRFVITKFQVAKPYGTYAILYYIEHYSISLNYPFPSILTLSNFPLPLLNYAINSNSIYKYIYTCRS